MLKQRTTNLVNQSTMFTKKQKKRSSSTSRNKQNISVSHNQSSSIDYFQGQDKCQPNCNNKKVAIKDKCKKQIISQNKQRFISKISNQASTLQIIQPPKIKNIENKQVQGVNKKTKTKNPDSYQLHAKSYIIHDYQISQIDQKCHKKLIGNLLNKPQISGSSTIFSVSTGNIQFSDRSKEQQKVKIFELPQERKFDQVEMGPKRVRKLPSGSNFSFKSKQKKLNPTKAAIIIQKTWRGYLTRKLLEQYIDSFEPIYQQQLRQIRSSRQSCHEINKFSTKRQQKSLFFDESEMKNNGLQQQISHFDEMKRIEENTKNEEKSLGNCHKRDLPLQYSNKARNNSNSNDQCSLTQRSIGYLKNSNSKVSEFTIKNSTQSQQNPRPHSNAISNQETTKIANRKFNDFSILHTVQLSISSSYLQPIDSLNYHCKCLQKLFSSISFQCLSQLKKEIKSNNLNLNDLMERKDALKDIVQNGRDFVKNVQQEMTKAFEEMKRITVKGCEQEQSQASETDRGAQNNLKFHHEKGQSSTLAKVNNFIKDPLQKSLKGQQQFCQIQLPTEEYSINERSPIQEEHDEQFSYQSSQNEDNQYHQSDTESFKDDNNSNNSEHDSDNDHHHQYSFNQQSVEILNQFLINLIDEYTEQSESKGISQLEYLCDTLKQVSCDSQNKTIIDRCLIEFIVEIMSQTWTLRQIYDGFKILVTKDLNQLDQYQQQQQQIQNGVNDDWKLFSTIRRWLDELQKWEMNIIKEVPSKMESSSFVNTAQNISFNQLRESLNSP